VTFNEVLSQTIALLQYHGRVSYRALKRQFAIDDDYLADLREAILFAHPQVVDEGGRGLVWTGISGTTTPPGTLLPGAPLGTQDPRAGQTNVLPSVPPLPDAERRQLTVLFGDLVDSTTLARHLDPEDYREVVRAYHATCGAVIERFDGYIAQYLGDGLLVYFGYPQAHEDDAQRAVRAGLEMLDALAPLQARLAADKGIRLAVRLGIHTGLVVVGAMGTGERQEALALGDTPNIAARL
jgi:hypothetical protein